MCAAARRTSLSSEVFSALAYPVLRDEAAARIQEQARVRGHAAGYADGAALARVEAAAAAETARLAAAAAEQQARIRVNELISTLNAAVDALHARTVPVLEALEHQVADAAVQVAEALLGRELSSTADSARSALHRALNPAVPAPVHTIRMNPLDLAAVPEDCRSQLQAALVPDPALQRADAVAEYPEGYLDARLSTALARLKAALAEDA